MKNSRQGRKTTSINNIKFETHTEVWVTTGPGTESEPVHGTITTSTGSPRSYTMEVSSGETRCNRSHIRVVPDMIPPDTPEPNIPSIPQTETPRRITTRSQTNTVVTKPDYLRY